MASIGLKKSLERAMEVEWDGHAFYEKAAGQSQHGQTQGIFEMLRDEEKTHAEYLLQVHSLVDDSGKITGAPTITMDKDFKLLFKEASA